MCLIAQLSLSSEARTTAGILLLTILAVELGGLTVLRMIRSPKPATDFQQTFARAGHAHAGVLVILVNRLVYLVYAGGVALTVGALTLGIGLLRA